MVIEVDGLGGGRREEILTTDALQFLEDLHHLFDARRRQLLAMRVERQRRLDEGERPGFLTETAAIRSSDWKVDGVPADLADRRVEITGPVERKMMINALNSAARVFMADFEDANTPTWANVIDGQVNLVDAARGTIDFTNPDGKHYALGEDPATLMVRPRGWHLVERHVTVDGRPISASLFDAGLYLFHNASVTVAMGSGPYFYLPKLEGHLEARLWNDVFLHIQEALGFPVGTVKATVLVETILAAFEMEEILFELRHHSAGLNAGRWDYIFSAIKKFRSRPDLALPDRAAVTMSVPFMRAYTEQLVRACHRRGAHAIGGMAAFIPNRRDAEITEMALAGVRDDKLREAGDGFDGTWVAHPDLVPTALEVFDEVLGERPNQLDRLREDVVLSSGALLEIGVPGAGVTRAGLEVNVSVGIRYIASWLTGVGAAAIDNLMEDAATAEISRSQVWQWARHGIALEEGPAITPALVRELIEQEGAAIAAAIGPEAYSAGRFDEAAALFDQVALSDDFIEFLTIPAYELID